MLIYLLLAIPVLIVFGLVYSIRRQAHATLADAEPEPDVDLSFRRPASLGEEPKQETLAEKPRDPRLAQLSKSDLVMEVLKECFDPEIPLNVVDLGLIYEVTAEPDHTHVRMTLTAKGCPSSEAIELDIRGKIQEAGFPNPKVEIVWEPMWTAHRISPEGRKSLGIDSAEAAAKLIPTYPDPGTKSAASEASGN